MKANRRNEAWRQVYRALEHGYARNACADKKVIGRFPDEIQIFASVFVQMQLKRHEADYDPDKRIFKSEVSTDIAIAKATITRFGQCRAKDKRAFATWVIFKNRT